VCARKCVRMIARKVAPHLRERFAGLGEDAEGKQERKQEG